MLENLLDNARQHAGPAVAVRIAGSLRDGVVELTVSDDGPGISAGHVGRVFTPFFTTARERGGSGLGLPIVRALLEAHRATIALDGPGPGARFTLRLPAAR
ncbi:MAG: ATP-binding protein [Acidobacteria bacterium]|nr:ATP-binding protein [Acidobacteriota bacterium]